MPEFTCSKCGQRVQGDVCAKCSEAASDEQENEAEPGSGCGWASYLIVGLVLLTAIGLIVPAFSKVREAAARAQTINNMKQIAMACHAYHDFNKRLASPAHVERKDGIEFEVQLSWRVSIYPYVESSPLYSQFDRSVGWDHPNNVRFQSLLMPVYESPYRDPTELAGLTRFQYFIGPETLFPENVPVKLGDIKDGTSQTFLFAEAEQPVIWTRPADMGVRVDQPLPLPADSFCAAMADGTVRFFERDTTSDVILRQLIHPNDGKPAADWDH